MVKEYLTPEMIKAGELLTQKLEEMVLPISVAMWFFIEEINEWRLMFVSPNASTVGSLDVYKQIQEARAALGSAADAVPFSNIGLMKAYDEVVRAIQEKLPVGPGKAPVRIRGAVNGRFIDDALIYRSAA